MFGFRSIGKFIRGKATPIQVGMSCILGAMLAFVPGFGIAPGLVVALALCLLILNANLFLALGVLALAKVPALLLTPISFEVGRFLLDGPTQGVFKSLINAPVTAWFGFEYYTVTGGMAIAIVFGVICAAIVIKALGSFRKRMAKLERDSDRFKKWAAKRSTKIVAFVFFGGGHGKKTYDEILKKKLGLPIRPMGVVIAALLVGGVFLARTQLSEQFVRGQLKSALEYANGATVDIERVELSFSEAKLTVRGLAIADSGDLEKDLFKAGVLEANVSTTDLLRKRMTIDLIEVTDAFSGTERETPGVLIGEEKKPEPEGEGKPLEEYLKDAEKWYKRLRQLERYLERLARKPEEEKADEDKTLQERLEEEIRALGYNKVRAEHLVEGSPTLLIRQVKVGGLVVGGFEDDPFVVDASNISTDPSKVDEALSLFVSAKSELFKFQCSLGQASRDGGKNHLVFQRLDLDADAFAGNLLPEQLDKVTEYLSGGRLDFKIDSGFLLADGLRIDTPMLVNLRDSTLKLPDPVGPTQIDALPFAIGIDGPISSPRLRLDITAAQQMMKQKGADLLVEKGPGLLRDALDNAGVTEDIDNALQGFLGEGFNTGDLLEGGAGNLLDNLVNPDGGSDSESGEDEEGDGVERTIRNVLPGLLDRGRNRNDDPDDEEDGG